MKNTRFYIAISLLIQSITFFGIFVAIFVRKRSLSGAILAVAAIGGIAGTYLLWRDVTDPSKTQRYMYGDMYDDEFDNMPPPPKRPSPAPSDDAGDEFIAI